MADQYGMSSALEAKKLENDKELLRYKKTLETPDPTPTGNIFNYSQAEPQKRVAAEKPEGDRKSTRLNSSHSAKSRMPSSA